MPFPQRVRLLLGSLSPSKFGDEISSFADPGCFCLKSKRSQKTQNFMLISNPLKKLWKNALKKVISQTSLTNMSKSEKSAFFRHVFANNFFWKHVFKTFSTDSKSAWNSAFFDTFYDFFKKKIFLGHISTFFELWLQMRRKRLKKTENLFLWMNLRI